MDKSDQILAVLKDIAAILPTLATKDDLARLEGNVGKELTKLNTEVAVLSGRLDEQRHILAAMIPRTIAAVPRAGSDD